MKDPQNPNQPRVGRVSVEELTSATASRKIVPIGFPRESILIAAVAAAIADLPEEKQTQHREAINEALKDNEPCLSFTLDPQGVIKQDDYTILGAHPDRIGRTLIYGGASTAPAYGRNGGMYMKTTVRKPWAIINGVLKHLGITPIRRGQPGQQFGQQFVQGGQQAGFGGFGGQPQGQPGLEPSTVEAPEDDFLV